MTANPKLTSRAQSEVRKFAHELEAWGQRLDSSMTLDEYAEFVELYGAGLARARRIAGVTLVAVNGSRARGLKAGWFRTPLADGTMGYFQRRVDDCMTAALASCAQISPHTVCDMQLDKMRIAGTDPEEIERVAGEKLNRWMDHAGVTIMVHPTPPISARRWSGVAPTMSGVHADDCLVTTGRDCLFDRALALPAGWGEPVSDCDIRNIEYGLTIEKR